MTQKFIYDRLKELGGMAKVKHISEYIQNNFPDNNDVSTIGQKLMCLKNREKVTYSIEKKGNCRIWRIINDYED